MKHSQNSLVMRNPLKWNDREWDNGVHSTIYYSTHRTPPKFILDGIGRMDF